MYQHPIRIRMKWNFSLSSKLFINNLFYAVPIFVLLYLMFTSYEKDLVFAQKEVMGNSIQKSAVELINLIVKNKKYSSDMNASLEEVLKQMQTVESSLLLDEKSLTDRKRDQLHQAVLAKTLSDFKEGKKEAYAVLKDLRELIIHTGDTSNLILDPDLDSYYVMDATLIVVPQLFDRLYEVDQFLTALTAKPGEPLSAEERVKMSVYIAMLKESDWGRAVADITTAINEDSNFYEKNTKLQGDVKNKLTSLDGVFKNYLMTLEEIASGKREKSSMGIEQTLQVINEGNVFYLLMNQTLNELLETRSAAIMHTRNKAMGTGVAAVFIALIVSVLTSLNFNKGSKRIADALRNLIEAVEVNKDTSDKLGESSNSLSSISTQQAAAVQETVSSLHEINAMSEKNSDSIRLSSQKTEEGKVNALNGKESMSLMEKTIKDMTLSNQEVFDEITHSNEELKTIIKIISDISERTKVINDIVFQTRLLAFNASVEAARAGEHGKGFAVVAEEIGKLASVSGNSAKEINDILHTANAQVEGIISKMNLRVEELTQKAKYQSSTGEKITLECVHHLDEIVTSISDLSLMMGEITMAINEQTKGYTEITKAIDQIDEGVHSGLVLSGETSQNAMVLRTQVGELRKIVKTIEKEVLGVSSAA